MGSHLRGDRRTDRGRQRQGTTQGIRQGGTPSSRRKRINLRATQTPCVMITTKHGVNTVECFSDGPQVPETCGGPDKSQRAMQAMRKATAEERLRPTGRRPVGRGIQRTARSRTQASGSGPILVTPMGRDPVHRERGKLSDRHRRSFPH